MCQCGYNAVGWELSPAAGGRPDCCTLPGKQFGVSRTLEMFVPVTIAARKSTQNLGLKHHLTKLTDSVHQDFEQ